MLALWENSHQYCDKMSDHFKWGGIKCPGEDHEQEGSLDWSRGMDLLLKCIEELRGWLGGGK